MHTIPNVSSRQLYTVLGVKNQLHRRRLRGIMQYNSHCATDKRVYIDFFYFFFSKRDPAAAVVFIMVGNNTDNNETSVCI